MRRNREVLATRVVTVLLGALLAAVLGACNRQPRFVTQEADSSAAGIDSSSIRLREVQGLWESGGGERAAEASAELLAERFAALAPEAWQGHADALLDSLGVGAETAAAECAVAVNFFARADPAAGTWPYLFWCGAEAPRRQAIEGRNLRLLGLAARRLSAPAVDPSAAPDPAADAPPPGVAALFGRRAGAGVQPVLMAWREKRGGGWELSQTLGPDSLGGIGGGQFEPAAEGSIELAVRTYRTPRLFTECATCPHVVRLHRFRWGAEGFERVQPAELVPSPYATFVQFVHALVEDDRAAAHRLVTHGSLVDHARALEMGRPRGAWRVAPAPAETPQEMLFFRGDHEAYRVAFAGRGGEWLIADIQEAPRSAE